MPDISMCQNKNCKFKNDCYRFTAIPNEHRQSYASFNCKDKVDDSYFWDNKEQKDRDNLLNEEKDE